MSADSWGANSGAMTTCYATGNISATHCPGGLAGDNHGTITRSYATGTPTGTGWDSGGLVGTNSGTIADCYSTGWAWGSVRVGGLIGSNTRDGKVIDCHTSGGAVGRADVGGLIGTGEGAVTNSFWDTEAAGLRKSAGGTGKTTAEMDIRSTFTDAGWNFVGENTNGDEDIWTIRKERYPRRSWELLR